MKDTKMNFLKNDAVETGEITDGEVEAMGAAVEAAEADPELVDVSKLFRAKPTLTRGATAKIVRGRKHPVGIIGEIIWVGPNKFQPGQVRIGLKRSNGEVLWVDGRNVEMI